MKRRIIILTGLILVIIILSNIGVLSQYSYYTAQYYKYNDKARIIRYVGEYRLSGLEYRQYQFLSKKYNLRTIFVKREKYNKFEQIGIEKFNNQMELYLNKRDGKDWKERFNKDVDSILKLNNSD